MEIKIYYNIPMCNTLTKKWFKCILVNQTFKILKC